MAAPALHDSSAAIEQLYQFGERLNESKDKSKVILHFPLFVCMRTSPTFLPRCFDFSLGVGRS